MAKLLRLIGVLAMAVLVASSSALPAPSTGAIGNAFRPTRRVIQITPAMPVIKDQAVQETGVIQMSATIGHPRYNRSDEPESSPAPDVIEQRVYSGETDRSADEVGSALETVLLMQGLEVDQQLSSVPTGQESTVLFAGDGAGITAVFEISPEDDGSTIEVTWTDR